VVINRTLILSKIPTTPTYVFIYYYFLFVLFLVTYDSEKENRSAGAVLGVHLSLSYLKTNKHKSVIMLT